MMRPSKAVSVREDVKNKADRRKSEKTSYTMSQARLALMDIISAYLTKGDDGKYIIDVIHRIPPLMISAPGLGKTETVQDVANELGIGFVSFPLTHYTRNSMQGLPVIADLPGGGKHTEFTMSEMLAAVSQKQAEGFDEGIIVLDEFTSTPDSIMPMMLAFLQTRNIGRYKLPDGWVIVLCGNPPEFNKSARNLDPATCDRVRRMDIEVSLPAFLEYCDENGAHTVIGHFLEAFPQCLYRCENKDGNLELVTCRSWYRLSQTLLAYEKCGLGIDLRLVHQFIKSDEIARKFYDFYTQFGDEDALSDVDEIFNGTYSSEAVSRAAGYSVREKWKRLDYFRRILDDRFSGCLDGSDEQKELCRSLDNLIGYALAIDSNGVTVSRFMEDISRSEDFMKAQGRFKGQNYMSYCFQKYHTGREK